MAKKLELNDNDQVVVTLTKARVAFTKNGKRLITPEPYEEGATPAYSGDFIVEGGSSDHKLLQEAVKIMEGKFYKGRALKGNKSPLRDGDEKVSLKTGEVYDGYENNWYISAKSYNQAPKVFTSSRRQIKEDDDAGLLKDGAFVNVQLCFYCSKNNLKNGNMSCSIDAVVYRSDEYEAFGSGGVIEIEDEESIFDGAEDEEEDVFGEDED